MRLGVLPSTLDKGIFIWTKEYKAVSIPTCFVDNNFWEGNEELWCIIKVTFKIGAERYTLATSGFISNRTLTAQSYSLRLNISTSSIWSQSAKNNHDNAIVHCPKRKSHCYVEHFEKKVGLQEWLGLKLVFMFVG